jgi:hypothetical protein
MSKQLFELMREQELQTTNFLPTKKEIQITSKKFVSDLLDAGEVNKVEVYAQALRLKEALSIIEAELKESLGQENFEAFGIKATFRNGGEMINYADDPIYAEMQSQLKEREELLKTVLKVENPVYDSEGIEIPKVSTTNRKSSLSITY